MISETKTKKAAVPALTSDRWHVVHASFVSEHEGARPFLRAIVSEHEDRPTAIASARALLKTLRSAGGEREPLQRDQVFVRRPGFISLLWATRSKAGRS
jgi:hypothetical protein